MIASQLADRRECQDSADQQKHKLAHCQTHLKHIELGKTENVCVPAGVILPISLMCCDGSVVNN